MSHETNTIVRNPKGASFGLGRIVAINQKTVHVFFPARNAKEALRFAATTPFEPVENDDSEMFVWLSNLAALRWHNERWVLSADVVTHQESVAKFHRVFPGGFAGDTYRTHERDYKLAAHERWRSALGDGQAEALLKAGELAELCQRMKRVIQPLNLLSRFESSALSDALKDVASATAFLDAVVRFSQGTTAGTQGAFETLVEATASLPVTNSPVLRWPVVTLFPFCADPNRHVFVKPEVTKAAAARVGFELHYQSKPNWTTYSAVTELARYLNRRLTNDGAQDFIDAQSFMWSVVHYDDPGLTPPNADQRTPPNTDNADG